MTEIGFLVCAYFLVVVVPFGGKLKILKFVPKNMLCGREVCPKSSQREKELCSCSVVVVVIVSMRVERLRFNYNKYEVSYD